MTTFYLLFKQYHRDEEPLLIDWSTRWEEIEKMKDGEEARFPLLYRLFIREVDVGLDK